MTDQRDFSFRSTYLFAPMTIAPLLFTPPPAGVASIFSCVRPVIFNDPVSNIPSFPGTGFFVQYGTDLFFLTAKHVIQGFDIENLQLIYNSKTAEHIKNAQVLLMSSIDPEDTAHADIACIYIMPGSALGFMFAEEMPFYLQVDSIVTEFNTPMKLFFRSLSPERSLHDYEVEFHRLNFLSSEARYIGASSQRDIHTMSTGVIAGMPSFDGLSGSPVFLIDKPNDALSDAKLAGMLVQGGHIGGQLHFISAEKILGVVEKVFTEILMEQMKERIS